MEQNVACTAFCNSREMQRPLVKMIGMNIMLLSALRGHLSIVVRAEEFCRCRWVGRPRHKHASDLPVLPTLLL